MTEHTNPNEPMVSVYMPTKNRAETAIRAIQSILNQTYKNIEIIVVDDGSDQDHYEKLSNFCSANKKVTLLKNQRQNGAPGARNTAILASSGVYITGVDDDDYWSSDRIDKFIKKSKKYKMLYADDILVSENKQKKWKKNSKSTLKYMWIENKIGNQVFAEANLWKQTSLFDEDLKAGQDYDMWCRLLMICGEAHKIDGGEQFIQISGDDRISRIAKKDNYYDFYEKHKSVMSTKQRWLHLTILKLTFEKVNLIHYIHPLMFLPIRTSLRLVKQQLKGQWYII